MVFKEIGAANSNKVKSRDDLDSEFGDIVRDNEGEAANYGIYYDDSEYDYMQHMRDLGGSGSVFVPTHEEAKGKGKRGLEDALRDISLDDRASEGGVSLSSMASSRAEEYFDQSMLPSEYVQKRSYQDQQNIPDAIAGFQPDMDPRLREVLEALSDEAYVDEEDDLFEELTAGGNADEVDEYTWREQGFWEDDDDEGWESDATVKASPNAKASTEEGAVETIPESKDVISEENDQGSSDWMNEFNKYKKDLKTAKAPAVKPGDAQSSVLTGASSLMRKGKKRKGALTNPSSYSMSSSALVRTEQHTLLDARFDKIEEAYAEDEYPEDASEFNDGVSIASGLSKTSALSKMSGTSRVSAWSATPSEAPQLTNHFNGIMDEFLNSHNRAGKNKQRVRRGKPLSGLEQLDEVRKDLGPARINVQKAQKA